MFFWLWNVWLRSPHKCQLCLPLRTKLLSIKKEEKKYLTDFVKLWRSRSTDFDKYSSNKQPATHIWFIFQPNYRHHNFREDSKLQTMEVALKPTLNAIRFDDTFIGLDFLLPTIRPRKLNLNFPGLITSCTLNSLILLMLLRTS